MYLSFILLVCVISHSNECHKLSMYRIVNTVALVLIFLFSRSSLGAQILTAFAKNEQVHFSFCRSCTWWFKPNDIIFAQMCSVLLSADKDLYWTVCEWKEKSINLLKINESVKSFSYSLVMQVNKAEIMAIWNNDISEIIYSKYNS